MKISLIVAYGRNRAIGKDNKMPWPPLGITWYVSGHSIDLPAVVNYSSP